MDQEKTGRVLATRSATAVTAQIALATKTARPTNTRRPRPSRTPSITPSPTPTPHPTKINPIADWKNRIAVVLLDGTLWVMKPDGSDKQPVHLPAELDGVPNVHNIAWAPREGKIAFLYNNQVLVADLESGITKILYRSSESITGGPIWNHRGDAMLFVDGRLLVVKPLVEDQLYFVGLENSRERWEPFSNLAFSQDDTRVYFRNENGLVVVPTIGGKVPKALLSDALYFNPSPKGNYMAVYIPNDGLRIISKECLESNQVGQCTTEGHKITSPDDETSTVNARWASDESRFITSFGLGAAAICRTAANVCDEFNPLFPIVLSNNPWSPDGTKLVLSALFDGGMTPSTLHLYDFERNSSMLIPGFEKGFMKSAWEASWSPN